jgi:hypothetical protein
LTVPSESVREDGAVKLDRLLVALVAGGSALLLAACTSGTSGASPSASPIPAGRESGTATATGIPGGTYSLSISSKDAEDSGNPHLLNLSPALVGRYELSLEDGRYSVTRNGQSAVPKPPSHRLGREGAYARYGFWIFLGVPPIGEGTFSASSSEVTFHSRKGACFQKGASPSLMKGRYRWKLDGGDLTLTVARATGAAPDSGDGCLGRSFVFSAHPWTGPG